MKISVCLASHNGSKYIRKQINSILVQLKSDDELIISDDYSTDDTISIIKSINDNRIKLYTFDGIYPKNKKYTIINHKISYNFLNALKYATGDIVFFSDQDDIWLPSKIEVSVKYLCNNDLIVSNFSIIDAEDNVILPEFYQRMPKKKNWIITSFNPHFTGCAMAFKRSVLEYAVPFPTELSCGHDNWIGLCANKYGKVAFVNEVLFMHRVHDSNNSYLAKKSSNSFFQKVNWRLMALINIIKR